MWHKGFISDIFRCEKIDTCIHLAAKISVSDSIRYSGHKSQRDEAWSNNGVNNSVYASSAAAYGEPRRLLMSEGHIRGPLSSYGASMLAGEVLVSWYRKSGKIQKAISLPFSNVYGEGQTLEYARVNTKD